jgi:hypothetical protein
MMFIDARLPVRFGPLDSRAADEAVLSDEDLAAAGGSVPAHAPGCVCCTPRSGAAAALAALFRARAVGHGPAFKGVLAVVGPAGEAAVRAAVSEDPVVSGRYRLG